MTSAGRRPKPGVPTFVRGDVVLVPFPYSDLSNLKVRPAVVLSNAAFNARGEDVIVCGMTSNLSDAAHTFLVGADDLASGRLAAPSRVKASKLATLKKTIIRGKVARLNDDTIARVLREVRSVVLE